jgi:hypothetical protein
MRNQIIFSQLEIQLMVIIEYVQISHFIKIRPVVAELFYAKGRMDEET